MEPFIHFSGNNIIADGISDQKALDILTEFFLGKGFYISWPVGREQANTYIIDAILSQYPRKYKKFLKSLK